MSLSSGPTGSGSSMHSATETVPCLMQAWGQHEAELRVWLCRQLDNAAEADDLLHKLFIRCLRQGSRFCTIVNARAWLFELARNLVTDHYRARKVMLALSDDIPAAADQEDPVASLAACLPRALAELAERDRDALMLCDLEGMKQEHYAALRDISLAAAKSRVQRARVRLKDHLLQVCQIQLDEQGKVCCFVAR